MSAIEIVNSISDEKKISSKEIKDNVQKIEKVSNHDRSKVSSQSTQFKSLFTCGGPRLKEFQYDIDINYAIGLLKKEDGNVNVYNHLQDVLNKLLLERPKTPLKDFEKYSMMLKRTYIQNEVNFERVFVDNINRNHCFKSLLMYKCALKKQLEQQKQYNNKKKNIRKSEVDEHEEKKTMNNINDIVHVQNLCEVNYMFNKAGFGLPMDEAALIYLTMNEMAQLNKFESIRFWGKIFGIKKMYYVIECKWSDTELERKQLLTVNSISHNSNSSRHKDNDATRDNSLQQESKLIDPDNALDTENEFESTVSYLEGEMDENSINHYDSWISLNDSESCTEILKSSSKTLLPPEMFGVGANTNVYFVTNKLNTKWIELESVKPHHIVEARKIKRYFTGKLKNPINNFPKFDGSENDYLRAQIARITSSTQICPRGYYIIDEKYKEDWSRISEKKSTNSSISIKKKNRDLILNENAKPISINNLMNVNYWVHKNPQIDINGVAYNLGFSNLSQSKKNEENFEEFEEENLSYGESVLNSKDDLFGNVGNDFSIDNTSAWKGVLCSPFDPRYSHTIMKSHVWPGAFAVAYNLQTDYMYIGWGQKHDSYMLYTILMDEIKMENPTQDDTFTVEFQEFTKKEKLENKEKQGLHKNKNKNRFPLQFNLTKYKGGEKVITYYTYE